MTKEINNKSKLSLISGGMATNCENCGNTFFRKASEIRRSSSNYCSQECYWDHHRVDWSCIICGKRKRVSKCKAKENSTCGGQCRSQRNSFDNLRKAIRTENCLTVETQARILGMSQCAVRTRLSRNLDSGSGDLRKRGSEAPRSKLSESNVRAIRAEISKGTTTNSLAREYGVSWPSIKAIKTGKSWSWLQ